MFSLDISKAYPADAGINKWIRGYRLNKESLYITDTFDINNAQVPNQLNFMTWGQVDISQAGVVKIKLNNKTCRLSYDKNSLEPSLEKIVLDDSRLSDVWGNEIFRISLTAKKTVNKGTYNIIIKI